MKASEVGVWLRQIAGKRDHRIALSDGNYLVLEAVITLPAPREIVDRL